MRTKGEFDKNVETLENAAKPSFPRNPLERKQIPVYRQTRPSVTKMLDDAYNVLGDQFDKYRAYGAYSRFSEKECQGFAKLVAAVTSLQESERKQVAMLALGNLSDAELDKLATESQRMLADRDPKA